MAGHRLSEDEIRERAVRIARRVRGRSKLEGSVLAAAAACLLGSGYADPRDRHVIRMATKLRADLSGGGSAAAMMADELPPLDAALERTWRDVRQELSERIPTATFDLWIEPLHPVDVRGTTIRVAGPARVATWVERRYTGGLLEAIRRHLPDVETVDVVAVAGEIERDHLASGPEIGESAGREKHNGAVTAAPTTRSTEGDHPMTERTLETIAVSKIKANPALNPRGVVDTESEAFLGLVESIKAKGVLQPILVGSRDGAYQLIAGYRRFAAVQKAGLEEIPALIAHDLSEEKDRLVAAMAENVAREDLSPVAEAEAIVILRAAGLKQVDVANRLGRSERWVRERERLARLPDDTRAAFDSGVVPLESMAVMETIAKTSPLLADQIARHAADEDVEFDDFKPDQIVDTIEGMAEENMATAVRVYEHGHHYAPEHLPIDAEIAAELDKVIADLPPRVDYRHRDMVTFDRTTIDAAKAYGCLLEIETTDRWGGKRTYAFLTDPEFMVDQARLSLEREKQSRIDKAKAAGISAEKETPAKDDPEAAKEARRKEREREAAERDEAHTTNMALGHALRKAFGTAKFDMPAARLLVEMVLAHDDSGLAERAVYTREDLITEERNKAGHLKINPEPRGRALETMRGEIDAAKTPAALLGVLMRWMLAAKLSDPVVTVQSKQISTSMPGVGVDYYGGFNAEASGVIYAFAKTVDGLPQTVRDRIDQEVDRLEKQAEEDRKAKEAADAKIEAMIAKFVGGVKAKQRERKAIHEKIGGWQNGLGHVDKVMVDAAIARMVDAGSLVVCDDDVETIAVASS